MNADLARSTPAAEGMDEVGLDGLDTYVRQHRYRLVNSVLAVRNGRVVLERYYNGFDDRSRHHIKSVWKSILSIVTGICLDKGLIGGLDDPVGAYLDEFDGLVHPYHRHMTVRHLLTMTSGLYWTPGVHYHCPMMAQLLREDDWTGFLSNVAIANVPGTTFQYKEWDVILLSALIGKAAGVSAYEFALRHLYGPLGIESGVWPSNAQGISYTVMDGEANSDLCAGDMAKLGLLCLNGGLWGGEPIVSRAWLAQSMSPSPANDHYGFLWRLYDDGYGARGFGGQEINVLPQEQFVSVIQATPTARAMSYNDIHQNVLMRALA